MKRRDLSIYQFKVVYHGKMGFRGGLILKQGPFLPNFIWRLWEPRFLRIALQVIGALSLAKWGWG